MSSNPQTEQNFPLSSFKVDASLKPRVASLPDLDNGNSHPLAAIVDNYGNQADFVENELIVVTDDTNALNDFLARWNGKVLLTTDMKENGLPDLSNQYLVRIESSLAKAESLADDLKIIDPNSRNDLRISSEAGLLTIAAAANETAHQKLTIGANWVLYGSNEAPAGQTAPDGTAYNPDPAFWPYMNRFGAQDIGIVGAWQKLQEAGRLGNRVRIAIFDAGFNVSPDLPSGTQALPPSAFGVANPWPTSTGGSAPWHGTNAAAAAMGVGNNNFGAAGPGGPVAQAVLIQSPSPTIFSVVNYLAGVVPRALATGPRIINMSFGVPVPASLFFLADPFNRFTLFLRLSGMLIFASADNQGQDVDALDCFFGACWERTWQVPCENDGVIGVGGLNWNSSARHPSSNFGSGRGERGSVRMFAPFTLWVGPDPATPGSTGNNFAQLVNGTSFSSPFAAGVAALIWAANLALNADDVERIMMETAHTGSSDPTVRRWLDANKGVLRALGWTEQGNWRWCYRCQDCFLEDLLLADVLQVEGIAAGVVATTA